MRILDGVAVVWMIFGALGAELEKSRNDGKSSEKVDSNARYTNSPQLVQIPIPFPSNRVESKKSRRQVQDPELNDTFVFEEKKHTRHRHRRRCKNREKCIKKSRNVSSTTPTTFIQIDNTHNFSMELQDSSVGNGKSKRSEFFNVLEAFFSGKSVYSPYSPISTKGSWLSGGYDIDSTLELVSSKSTMDNYREFEEEDSLKKSLSSIYLDHHNPMHENLVNLMTELFQSLNNNSVDDDNNQLTSVKNNAEGNGSNLDKGDDFCQRWLDAKDKLNAVFLNPSLHLPACPCCYPSNIFYNDKIWDERQGKHFRWRDVSSESQRLDVYKPGASYCVRSLLAQGSGNAAAQHCCYDSHRRLLTRGSGAGSPYFVSPEASSVLHEKIDILPWQLCKGDFSRFNKMRPPNNDNDCEQNPDDEEYQRQKDERGFF